MKRTPITVDISRFPEAFHGLLSGADLYDSSCSKEAKVYYIDKEDGFFLKAAPKGTLKQEADMNRYFYGKGLGPEVLGYLSQERDWMLTRRIPGEDCTHPQYLSDPRRLCDTLAQRLRQLHEEDASGCPVKDRNDNYLRTAEANRIAGTFDASLFPIRWSFASREEAWGEIARNGKYLKADTLLHGDYCLPNILLRDWSFSGFIDLDCAGTGDRHIDVFWGSWTLFFNLKTDAYFDRFLDAYGRDVLQPETLRTIAAFEVFR